MISEQQYQTIATRAYLLWEQEGQPQGRSLEHWLTAEREVLDDKAGTVEPGGAAKSARKIKPAAVKTKRAAAPKKAASTDKPASNKKAAPTKKAMGPKKKS